MSETPISDALKKLEKLPADQVQVGVVATKDDVGAVAEGQKDLGKPGGWSAAFTAEYWREKGWSAAGWLRWKK